jgi:hypothetical protein
MRGWVWASLAIAAAILIMLFQPGREQNAVLPTVAQNSKGKSADTDRQLSESGRGGLAIDERASSPAAAPESPAPSILSTEEPAAAPQDMAQGRAAGSSSESFDTPIAEGRPNADTFAAQAPADVPEQKSAAPALATAALEPPAGAAGAAAHQVVVHVLTKRSAFENNAFEDLLRKNGVNFETSTRSFDASGALAAREPASATSSREEPQSSSTLADGTEVKVEVDAVTDADVEVVLVDAPSSTILSCMDALNKDAANYLGVSVEEPAATKELQEKTASETPLVEKLTTDMAKFNRGSMPQQQDKLARDKFYFSQPGDDNLLGFSREHRGGGGLGGYGGQKIESRSPAAEPATDLARARRLQPQTRDGRENLDRSSNIPTAGAAPLTVAKDLREESTELKRSAPADSERMQVLFVLHPSDAPAPSLKAKNQPE